MAGTGRGAVSANFSCYSGVSQPASQLETLCKSYQHVQAYDQVHSDGATAAASAATQVAALRTVTRRSLDNGMVKFDVVLASDEAAIVWEALNAATAKNVQNKLPQNRRGPNRLP